MPTLGDYLDLDVTGARRQWREILDRPSRPDLPGFRGPIFLPVETLMCLAASLVVSHREFSGSNRAPRAPSPVPELARLFQRPPTSVLAKMENLDGTRIKGAKHELETAATLMADPSRLLTTYSVMIAAARDGGIGPDRLPDFLGGDLHLGQLLGQDELSEREIETAVAPRVARFAAERSDLGPEVSERLLVSAARVGQHRFASAVLANFQHRCGFCGLSPGAELSGRRLLVASHIKPWRVSDDRERLDPSNGIAACPSHDVAFDAGLLWVNGGFRIHAAPALAVAVEADAAMARTFAAPGISATLILPEDARPPGDHYLQWHRKNVVIEYDGQP